MIAATAPSNVHQTAARIRKAATIAALLVQHGITAHDLAGLQPHQWQLIAQAAQVNPPSAVTQALVISILLATQRSVTGAQQAPA